MSIIFFSLFSIAAAIRRAAVNNQEVEDAIRKANQIVIDGEVTSPDRRYEKQVEAAELNAENLNIVSQIDLDAFELGAQFGDLAQEEAEGSEVSGLSGWGSEAEISHSDLDHKSPATTGTNEWIKEGASDGDSQPGEDWMNFETVTDSSSKPVSVDKLSDWSNVHTDEETGTLNSPPPSTGGEKMGDLFLGEVHTPSPKLSPYLRAHTPEEVTPINGPKPEWVDGEIYMQEFSDTDGTASHPSGNNLASAWSSSRSSLRSSPDRKKSDWNIPLTPDRKLQQLQEDIQEMSLRISDQMSPAHGLEVDGGRGAIESGEEEQIPVTPVLTDDDDHVVDENGVINITPSCCEQSKGLSEDDIKKLVVESDFFHKVNSEEPSSYGSHGYERPAVVPPKRANTWAFCCGLKRYMSNK